MTGIKVLQVRKIGFVHPEIGRISFNRQGRVVAVKAWDGMPAIKSIGGRIEEVRGPVPDLFVIQLVTGLVDLSREVIPFDRRTPQVLVVEPRDFPRRLAGHDLSQNYDYLALCSDLFEKTGKRTYEQRSWINLTDRQEDRSINKAILQKVAPPSQIAALARTGLVNLCESDGAPKNEVTLGEQIAEMQAELLALA